ALETAAVVEVDETVPAHERLPLRIERGLGAQDVDALQLTRDLVASRVELRRGRLELRGPRLLAFEECALAPHGSLVRSDTTTSAQRPTNTRPSRSSSSASVGLERIGSHTSSAAW